MGGLGGVGGICIKGLGLGVVVGWSTGVLGTLLYGLAIRYNDIIYIQFLCACMYLYICEFMTKCVPRYKY